MASKPGSRLLPIVDQLRSYERPWLRGDLVAGVVVAALIIPKNLGYAGIAGVPLENGLYAAAAGAILYALFGTCRQISMGPSSGLAAVAGGAVLAAGLTDGLDVATLVAGITLVSGLLFLVMAVFRMGWLSQFLSRAVVTGFLFGAAIDVVIGELPKLTAHRQRRRQLLPGARVVAAHRRRGGRRDGARGSGRPGRRLRSPVGRSPGPRFAGAAGRRPARLVGVRPRGARGRRGRGHPARAAHAGRAGRRACWWTTRGRSWWRRSRW